MEALSLELLAQHVQHWKYAPGKRSKTWSWARAIANPTQPVRWNVAEEPAPTMAGRESRSKPAGTVDIAKGDARMGNWEFFKQSPSRNSIHDDNGGRYLDRSRRLTMMHAQMGCVKEARAGRLGIRRSARRRGRPRLAAYDSWGTSTPG